MICIFIQLCFFGFFVKDLLLLLLFYDYLINSLTLTIVTQLLIDQFFSFIPAFPQI